MYSGSEEQVCITETRVFFTKFQEKLSEGMKKCALQKLPPFLEVLIVQKFCVMYQKTHIVSSYFSMVSR